MDITKKYVPCLIMSVLLVFSLIGFTATFNFNFFALSESTYIAASDDNDVPQKVHDEIETYFTHSEGYSGIPADVYMSSLSVENVKAIIDSKIHRVISDYVKKTDAEFDSLSGYDYSALKKSITDYFTKFAKDNNVKIDKEYKEQLKNTISTAINEIESFADIYMFKEVSKTSLLQKTRNIYPDLTPATYALCALSILFILILMAVCLKRVGLGCYWVGVSAMCSAAIMLVPTLWIKFSGFTDGIIVTNPGISSAVTGAVANILRKLIWFECGLFAFGLLMMLIYAISSVRRKNIPEVTDDDDDEDEDTDTHSGEDNSGGKKDDETDDDTSVVSAEEE